MLWNNPLKWGTGWDWQSTQPWLRCPEWLRVSQARQWRCPAAVHLYPGPWFIWLQLQTWVNSWASSQHGRQASGPGKKSPKLQGKLGRSRIWKTTWKFSKVEARALFGWQTSINMAEDHVSSLFCFHSVCLTTLTTIKLNSISQSDQSSWKTFCESLYLKQIDIWFWSCCCGNQPVNLKEL